MIGITYIITVYNKAAALPEVVRSLMAQEGDYDCEYIFVDDGSTDGSLLVLQELCPYAIIISQANKGPSSAINVGLKRATKQWIYLADGDDYIYPGATQVLLKAAIENDGKVVTGKHSNDPSKDKRVFDGAVEVYENALEKALSFYPIGASTTIVDRELALSVGGCDERVFVQDYSLALRLSRYSKFVSINLLVARNSAGAHERLSGNKVQENHDTSAARYFFICDNLDIDYKNKYMVLQLFLRKAFKWHLRHGGAKSLWSKHLWRYLASRIDLGFNDKMIIRWMKEGLEVYEGRVESA